MKKIVFITIAMLTIICTLFTGCAKKNIDNEGIEAAASREAINILSIADEAARYNNISQATFTLQMDAKNDNKQYAHDIIISIPIVEKTHTKETEEKLATAIANYYKQVNPNAKKVSIRSALITCYGEAIAAYNIARNIEYAKLTDETKRLLNNEISPESNKVSTTTKTHIRTENDKATNVSTGIAKHIDEHTVQLFNGKIKHIG